MASKVDLCNMALSKVGEGFIRDIDENTKPAKLCALMYPIVRDCVLRSYPWRFALKRYSCAPLMQKPLFDYDNAFQIPADCLRIVRVQNDIPYAREGDAVYANVSVFNFVGIARVLDENKYDDLFVAAFTAKLAAEMVMSLTSTPALKEQLSREYENAVADARRASAKEASQDCFAVRGWLDARM